jgi:teichuronic acid biosynthesis glycosyltransferase TuaC
VTGEEICFVNDPQQSASGASRRLRVVVFSRVFPRPGQPVHGTFVLERIRCLAQIADVQVISPIPWFERLNRAAPVPETRPILAVRFPRFWYLPKTMWALRGVFLFLSTLGEFARVRRSFDFDLIDAHFAYPDGFAAVLLGWWFRRPVCVTLRGTIIPISRKPVGRWLCDWTIRRAAQIIAVSANLTERARQGGVPAQRVATIANGVDTDRFQLIDAAVARRRLGLPETGRLIVSVGHISPRKGFQRVIRALPQLAERQPDLRFAIIGGKGTEEDNSAELHALVERLHLSERVIFAGEKSPDEVASWIAASEVFVLASDFEGCPNVILEALACGRPVVATKVGDIERMVPSFAGVLFENPEDDAALAECLTAALRQEWDRARIRDHVVNRSWQDVARRVAAQWRLAIDASESGQRAGSSDSPLGVAMRSRRT